LQNRGITDLFSLHFQLYHPSISLSGQSTKSAMAQDEINGFVNGFTAEA